MALPANTASMNGMGVTPDVSATAAPDLSQLVNAPLSGGGPYGEGQVSDALQRLRTLKGYLTAGQITSSDYMQAATPLVQQAAQRTGSIAGIGGKAASAVNPIWNEIQNSNFVKADQGKWQATLPLSEQEFAQLPDSAKPTADQINKGLVPASALPGNMALNTVIQQQQQQQQTLAQQTQQQAQTNQQNTQQQLQDLFKNFMGQTKQNYDQGYQDIASTLQNQQNQAMQNLTKGQQGENFRDYYNNLGLLNSGAFNTGLANQFGNIQQNTQNELLQAKLAEQNAVQNAAQQGIGALSQFGVGAEQQLQDISNQNYSTQSGLGIGGLQRQFSLEDFYNQSDLQRQLAQLQQNSYLSALNQQQQNPWTQLGLGVIGGFSQGAGQALGRSL